MRKRNSWMLTAVVAGSFLASIPVPAFCMDGHREEGQWKEHDEARYLVDKGNIRPLPEVLRALHSRVAGNLIDVRLQFENLRWVYLCELITPAGRRLIVPIDAASLAILDGGHPD